MDLSVDGTVESAAAQDATAYRFGRSNDFGFDFTLHNISTAWPGPPYDEHARFAPGVLDKPRVARPRSKLRAPKRKLSQHDSIHPFRSTKPSHDKTASEHGKQKTHSRPVQYYGSPPRRAEPLRFLTLPGEIRNHIYTILTVTRHPLVAQFKPIVLPHKRPPTVWNNSDLPPNIVLRRFPREPVLALGNRQLRDEVLSTFYSKNRFVVRQTDHVDLKRHSLLRATELQRWTPKWNMAASLTHIEVHFTVCLSVGEKRTSNFILRRVTDGIVRVAHETDTEEYCTCFDERVGRELGATMSAEGRECRDLVQQLGEMMRVRRERLESDSSFIKVGDKFRTKGLSCPECGKKHLRLLEAGL